MVEVDSSCIYFTSKENENLEKMKLLFAKYKLNLILSYDFNDFSFKALNIVPQIIFIDYDAGIFDDCHIRLFNEIFKTTKSEFYIISNNNESFESENFAFIKFADVKSILDKNIYSWRYKNAIERKIKSEDSYWTQHIKELLYRLGITPKNSGFNYIKDILSHMLINDGKIGALSKTYYPLLATRYKTSPFNVERSIRSSIDCGWNASYSLNNWHDEFKCVTIEQKMKPSNREFLCLCYERLIHLDGQRNFC